MKKLLFKYRVLAGGALFVAAVSYVTGCCCPCYYPLDYVSDAPMAPKVLPKMKDLQAPALDGSVNAISY